MTPVRTFLVDDHALMRQGLISLLSTQEDIKVVGDTDSGETALAKVPRLKPDLVIMDLVMPGMDGAETTQALKQLLPTVRILILTSFGMADGIARALEAGANGAVMKTIKLAALMNAIRTIVAGGTVIAPEIQQMLDESTPIQPLSSRQQEILESVTRGLSNKDIGKQLGISAPTVNEHIITIFSKLGAANRAEAVAIALRKHLLKA